jgi:hypothetical protein
MRPRNPMSPVQFIPIAEKTGQIAELGRWVLTQACKDARAWPKISLAVNVSTVQLQRQDFPAVIEGILEATGFDPRRLELEITETAWSKNEQAVLRTLQRLQKIGISFLLDDWDQLFQSYLFAVSRSTRSRSTDASSPASTRMPMPRPSSTPLPASAARSARRWSRRASRPRPSGNFWQQPV